MSDFNKCLLFVLKHEGGLFVDKETNEVSKFGISQKFLESIHYPNTDPRALILDRAKDLYLKYFWSPYSLELVNPDLVAAKIFDMIVNMGPYEATLTTQIALQYLHEPIKMDGIFGPQTRNAIDEVLKDNPPQVFINELINRAAIYYNKIAVGDKQKFLAGWLERLDDVSL